MDENKLEKLFRYLKLLTAAYFDGDPLNVVPSIKRVTFLIEMEFNETFEEEKDEYQV